MRHLSGLPNRLLLGITDVDDQHFELAGVLDRIAALTGMDKPGVLDAEIGTTPSLNDCLGSRRGGSCEDQVFDGALELLDELERLAARHFVAEEKLMSERKYPLLGTHKTEHLMLLAELRDFIREIRIGRECLQPCHLVALKGWFFGHIALADKAFGDFCKKAE